MKIVLMPDDDSLDSIVLEVDQERVAHANLVTYRGTIYRYHSYGSCDGKDAVYFLETEPPVQL